MLHALSIRTKILALSGILIAGALLVAFIAQRAGDRYADQLGETRPRGSIR